jgi:hypothetical protein
VTFNDRLEIQEKCALTWGRRRAYEKNWQFFAHEGQLLCVYSLQPHVVLRRSAAGMECLARSEWRGGFGGVMGGGTPPIEFEGEYLSFFHSWIPWEQRGSAHLKFRLSPVFSMLNRLTGWPFPGAGTWPHRLYSAGAYTFQKKWPFRVTRCSFEPLISPTTIEAPAARPACVFPAGACWHEGKVLLSYGYHDQEGRLATFTPSQLRSNLTPIPEESL